MNDNDKANDGGIGFNGRGNKKNAVESEISWLMQKKLMQNLFTTKMFQKNFRLVNETKHL